MDETADKRSKGNGVRAWGPGQGKSRFTRLPETGVEGEHWGLIKSVGGFFVKRRKARGEGQGCPGDAL